MRFVAVHKAATYLMVLTSTLSVFASGELAPLAPWAFLVLTVLSAVRPDTPGPSVLVERLWTLASLGVLVFLGVGVFQGEPALIQGVYLLLWLMLARLFNRRTSRDYLQLYVLSFMLVVASTAVDADLTYGVQFLLYVVFGTWALILFHLKREMEENYLLKYGDTLEGRPVQIERVLNSRKLVGLQFLVATSAVALLVFVGSTAVFVFFPRVGLGMFFQKQRPGILMSGFSDRVELGQFGTVKDDPTVVMRVELPGHTGGAPPPRYWRGLTLDHYDGTTWTKSRPRRWRLERALSGMAVFRPDLRSDDPLVQSIYLEPMETRVLFGADAPFAVSFADSVLAASSGRHRRGLQMDAEGDVHYEQADEVAFKYTALSNEPKAPPAAWSLSLAAYRERVAREPGAEVYLQLPAGLDPRVAALTARVVGDATTVGQAVERVRAHLARTLTYSLTLERDPSLPPLEDFLFKQRRGHCEYFATALAVMLRTQGIMTRNVNGFLGGAWNDFGRYVAVRQGDAHAWTEVWAGAWVTQDATPVGETRRAESTLWTTFAAWSDAARLRWYKYVIEYDLDRQIGVFQSVADTLRGLFGGRDERRPEATSGASTSSQRSGCAEAGTAAGGVAVVVIGVLALRRRRARARTSAASRPGDEVAAVYSACVALYAAAGYPRGASMTADEFVHALAAQGAPGLDLARAVVAHYSAERFGGADENPAAVRRLRAALADLKRTLAQREGRSP